MIKRYIIHGAKGGGKGGGGDAHVATEAPNTLRSVNKARLIDVISEGEIGGLVNGARSIRLDGVPVQNPDGTYNFQGFVFEERVGLPSQEYLKGFSAVENEVNVGIQIKKTQPVIRTISNDDVDACRVVIRIPNLSYQDTSNGDVNGTSVQVKVSTRADNGNWVDYPAGSETRTFGLVTPPMTRGFTLTYGYSTWGRVSGANFNHCKISYRRVGDTAWTLLEDYTGWVPANVSRQGSGWFFLMRSEITRSFTLNNLPLDTYEVKLETTQGFTFLNNQAVIGVLVITISGKCTAPYEIAYRVDKPVNVSQEWSYKVERITEDSEKQNVQNQTYLRGHTEIVDHKLMYPNVALIGLSVDAQQFGSNIATRQYEVKGLKVKIPTNYDPSTRIYTGLWNGTWKMDWTDNPAWILYDVLTNNRYGLGKKIKESMIDKVSLYKIAQYNDEMIADGFGNTEPRYKFNGVLSARKSAYDIINFVSSTFKCMVYFSLGKIYFTQDAPGDVVKLFHPGNVENGEFVYTSTAERTTFSTIYVTWNNPADNYNTNIEIVEDEQSLREGTFNTKEVIAYGCTSRGQAHRFGKWILEAEREGVTFKTGVENVAMSPGEIVAIHDPSYAGIELGGRVVSATSNTITVDIEVEIKAGQTYSITVELASGQLVQKVIANTAGKYTTLNIEGTFTEIPQPFYSWGITSSQVAPRKFRIISITEASDLEYEINAVYHDETKFARIEQNLNFDEPDFSVYPTGALIAPSNIIVKEYMYMASAEVKTAATVSWETSPDPRIMYYELFYRLADTDNFTKAGDTSNNTIDIKDTKPGTYEFKVRGVAGTTLKTPWTTLTLMLSGILTPPADVENFSINISNQVAYLSWTSVPDLDLDYYEIRYCPVLTGATWNDGTFMAQVAKNVTSANFPAQVGSYLIKAVDTTGHKSVNEKIVYNEISKVISINLVSNEIEHPYFEGEKDRTVYSPTYQRLQLDANEFISGWSLLSLVETMALGEDQIFQDEGYYYFKNNPFDLGSKYVSRITGNLKAYGEILGVFMSDWAKLSDVVVMSGVPADEWGAGLQIRYSDDNITWSGWNNLQFGEYAAQYFEFRIKLTTQNPKVTPMIAEASVSVDMPERIENGVDIICPVDGFTVNYSAAFKSKPALAINPQGMEQGDIMVRRDEDETKFSLDFYNFAGNKISRTFDFIAVGYGYKVS